MQTFEDCELGVTEDEFSIELREENQLAVARMAQQCQSSIEIVSRDLDPDLFDTNEFIEAVKLMVSNNHRSSIRILVFNPKRVVSRRHRLLDLARTLTSNIDIRVPSYEHMSFSEMIFIADTTGYLHRNYPGRFEATINFNDKRTASNFRKTFNEMWDKASQDTNLRKLAI